MKHTDDTDPPTDSLPARIVDRLATLSIKPLPVLVCFAVVGTLLYANILNAPFFFDDRYNIVSNPHIRMVELNWDSLSRAFHSIGSDRPLIVITFAFNYYFGKLNPWGYHAVNIVIHIFSGFVLYLLARQVLTALSREQKHSGLIAFIAALIWFVHPIQIQSVTYITQRMTSLAALFFILSLYCYLKGRGGAYESGTADSSYSRRSIYWYATAVLSGVLAMACKENTVTLPFVIIMFEWALFQDCRVKWLFRNTKWIVLAFIPGIALYWLTVFESIFVAPDIPVINIQHWDLFPIYKLLTVSRVMVHYFSLLILPFPSRLNVDYDFQWSTSILDPWTTLPATVFTLFLIILALFRAGKNRMLFLGIGWFFINLAIESTIIPLKVIFEHRLYLPSMMIILMVVYTVAQSIRQKQLLVMLTVISLGLCSTWTVQRNQTWQDPVTLWLDNVIKAPGSVRPHINLGLIFDERGETDKALYHLHRAKNLDPENAKIYNNLGSILLRQGKIDEALAYINRALELAPEFVDALVNLGAIHVLRQDIEMGKAYYRKALTLVPKHRFLNYQHHIIHYNLGNVLLMENDIDQAIIHYEQSIKLAPDFAKSYNNLAVALENKGLREMAIRHYVKALRIDPDYVDSRKNLRDLLLGTGSLEQAIDRYHKALGVDIAKPGEKQRFKELLSGKSESGAADHKNISIQPGQPGQGEVELKRGYKLLETGQFDEATQQFRSILKATPGNPDARFGLGLALAGLNQTEPANEQFRKLLQTHPNHSDTHFKLANGLLKLGKLNEAEEHYIAALHLNPSLKEAHNNLGIIFFRMGQPEKAKMQFRKAVELDPGFKAARTNLEQVTSGIKND